MPATNQHLLTENVEMYNANFHPIIVEGKSGQRYILHNPLAFNFADNEDAESGLAQMDRDNVPPFLDIEHLNNLKKIQYNTTYYIAEPTTYGLTYTIRTFNALPVNGTFTNSKINSRVSDIESAGGIKTEIDNSLILNENMNIEILSKDAKLSPKTMKYLLRPSDRYVSILDVSHMRKIIKKSFNQTIYQIFDSLTKRESRLLMAGYIELFDKIPKESALSHDYATFKINRDSTLKFIEPETVNKIQNQSGGLHKIKSFIKNIISES